MRTAIRNPALLLDAHWVTPKYARLAIVAAAALILFLRMPLAFLSPQLWAEDGVLLIQAHNSGWRSILDPLGGTLVVYARFIANCASSLPLQSVPTAYFVAALAAVLTVVSLATSPRFDIPHRGLAALAIVLVPAGEEVLLALANTQWVLPVGLIVLLFSRSHKSRSVLAMESVYVLLTALSGPVGVFALPLFLCRGFTSTGDDRTRLSALSIVLMLASAVQISMVLTSLNVFNLIPPREYSYALWLSIPLNWLGPLPRVGNTIGYGVFGAIVSIVVATAAIAFASKQPYRFHKLAMIIFAGAILYSGMFKYRSDLGTGYGFNPRYIYAGSIFFVWFLCIAISVENRFKDLAATASIVVVVNCLIVTAFQDRPRVLDWDKAIIGQSELIPISPPAWFVKTAPGPWTVLVKAGASN